MKDMTRRNFLKLSGAAALAVSAGALTACSGGGGGGSAGGVSTTSATLTPYQVELLTCSLDNVKIDAVPVEDITGYNGYVAGLTLLVTNNAGSDKTLRVDDIQVWMDGNAATVVGLDGEYGTEITRGNWTGLKSSVRLKAGNENEFCIYATKQSNTEVAPKNMKAVFTLGNVRYTETGSF